MRCCRTAEPWCLRRLWQEKAPTQERLVASTYCMEDPRVAGVGATDDAESSGSWSEDDAEAAASLSKDLNLTIRGTQAHLPC